MGFNWACPSVVKGCPRVNHILSAKFLVCFSLATSLFSFKFWLPRGFLECWCFMSLTCINFNFSKSCSLIKESSRSMFFQISSLSGELLSDGCLVIIDLVQVVGNHVNRIRCHERRKTYQQSRIYFLVRYLEKVSIYRINNPTLNFYSSIDLEYESAK